LLLEKVAVVQHARNFNDTFQLDLSPSAAYPGRFQRANKIRSLASQLVLRRKKVVDLLSYASVSANPLLLDFLKLAVELFE